MEFWSMGSKSVTFVDQSQKVLSLLKENARDLGISSVKTEVARLPSIVRGSFDVVFFDPPYNAKDLLLKQVEILRKCGNVKKGGILVIEVDRSSDLEHILGFDNVLTRKVNGKSKLLFFRPS
jgi:16S rRNA G966 N2-methylase RsmD